MPCRAPDYAAVLEYQAYEPGPSENVGAAAGDKGYALLATSRGAIA